MGRGRVFDLKSKMNAANEEEAYQVRFEEGRHQIVDAEGNVYLDCGDPASAGHYAELMNRAFRRGYKAGLRKGWQKVGR